MNKLLNWIDVQGTDFLFLVGLLLISLLLLKVWFKKKDPKRKFKNGDRVKIISLNTNAMVSGYKDGLYHTSYGVDVPEQDLEKLD